MGYSTLIAPNSKDDNELYDFAQQLVAINSLPFALRAIVEMGILEIIARAGPGASLSPSEIAAQLPTRNPDAPSVLNRILRVLACHSILTCSPGEPENQYGLAPVCKFLVKDQDGISLIPRLMMQTDKKVLNSWYHLKDAVLDGCVPFGKANGMNVFQFSARDPKFVKDFNHIMAVESQVFVRKVLEIYRGFEGVRELMDVGGGIETTLNLISASTLHLKGINFDIKHVIEDAPSYPSVEHVSGDMFESLPSAEAILMKWGDEHCLKVLKNCYKAIPKSGKIIVVDSILPADSEASPASKGLCLQDLNMMGANQKGKERTYKEFELLAKESGFSGIREMRNVYTLSVIEFYKN